MRIVTALVLCSLLSLASNCGQADEYETWLSEYEQGVQAGDGKVRRLSNILDARSLAELVDLTNHSNDSIATQAAWKTVAVMATDEWEKLRDYEKRENINGQRERIIWFIGFLEGRNRITAPKWWKEIVAGSTGKHLNEFRPSTPKEKLEHSATWDAFTCPIKADVIEDRGSLVYIEGNDKVRIPVSLLKDGMGGHLAGKFIKDRCFIAQHNLTGSHLLVCVNRSDNKELWKANVCGVLIGGNQSWGYVGSFNSWAEVVPTSDQRLFVFGASDFGFYVHAFDQSNGETLLMFSNNF